MTDARSSQYGCPSQKAHQTGGAVENDRRPWESESSSGFGTGFVTGAAAGEGRLGDGSLGTEVLYGNEHFQYDSLQLT